MATNTVMEEFSKHSYNENSYDVPHRPTFKAETPKDSHAHGMICCIVALSLMTLISLGVSIATIMLLVNYQSNQTTSSPTKSPGPTKPISQTGTALTSGAVYVRWGRKVCPLNATLVYTGLAGGGWYGESGGGSNRLCLPETPEYDQYESGNQEHRARVYSSEYQTDDFQPLQSSHDHDAPCAVCRATNRGSLSMIPAMMNCPSGWTKEYHGYLMAQKYDHWSSLEFVCVDRNPENVPGSGDSQNGALFYPTEARCNLGNLPCTPYIDGAELTCVVCTK